MKTSSHSTNSDDDNKRIDTLFVKFGAIYGQRWLSTYKNQVILDTAKNEWADALERFDNTILKEAYLQCRERHRSPPSLGEFVEYCREKQVRREPEMYIHRKLDAAPIDVAEAHLKKIRAILGR